METALVVRRGKRSNMCEYIGDDFGTFLAKMRQESGLTLERLSEGLCTASMMCKFENGERLPDKLCRDRLLARIGKGADVFETYLEFDEYQAWESRQQILNSIVSLEEEKAEEFIKRYEQKCNKENVLEKQFILTMQAQLGKRRGMSSEELGKLYNEALMLTVPNSQRKQLANMCLSMQELFLLLEAAHYSNDKKWRIARYEEVLQYIENSFLDEVCSAKIYPQTVYYLCLERLEEQSLFDEQATISVLQLCNRAIDMLRNASGAYYLWELLQVRGKVLQQMMERLVEQKQEKKLEGLKKLKSENDKWLWAYEEIYSEFHRPFEMQDNCYLFVEKEAYCIGDVIRIRRKMLGFTQERLCEGICSPKTIVRIEKNKLRTQRPIVKELFTRLNLPMDFQRTNLITDSVEAQNLMNALKVSINERERDKVEKIIVRLREIVSQNILMNRQTLDRIETANLYHHGKLSKEEYVNELVKILEYTLPYERVVSGGDIYLTNEEMCCVQNMIGAIETDNPELERCMYTLENYYHVLEARAGVGAFINLYEVAMSAVSSQRGNLGKYDSSDAVSYDIIKNSLQWKRMFMISQEIYNLLWNHEQRLKNNISTSKGRDVQRDLKICIAYCSYTKQKNREQSFQRRLERRGIQNQE